MSVETSPHPLGSGDHLLAAAAVLNDEWGCLALVGDEAVVPCTTRDLEVAEHVLHELAHAALLGVEPGPNISDRLGVLIRDLDSRDADLNEVEAHRVVMEVFARIGYQVGAAAFVEAAALQMQELSTDARTIERRWRRFRRTTRFEAAVQTVLAALLEHEGAPLVRAIVELLESWRQSESHEQENRC